MTKQKEVITAQDTVIKAKYAEVAKHKEQNNDSQLKIKELDHNISKHKREAEDGAAKVCLCSFFILNQIFITVLLKNFRKLLDGEICKYKWQNYSLT